ncbi:hypothetical protein [Dictyobacter formicarum]|uniref:C2H2-type domain-containing protein n=1 Tax=Dictyobacter formicarum TaxID=2778368 RepID=A0ABQ3VIV6_9CHLR|nr:hypothetical protein [Dictyobacter formicarum]GHO85406.1 hypothetical protein KSZ_34120 [Dictyobacter formicarum]
MLNSRLTAFIAVMLLIVIASLVTIGIVQGIGMFITHGPGLEQTSGTIVSINPDHSFMLKTANGTLEHFQCNERCMGGESHMYRHLKEHAHTDVYFMRTANGTLIATDVD